MFCNLKKASASKVDSWDFLIFCYFCTRTKMQGGRAAGRWRGRQRVRERVPVFWSVRASFLLSLRDSLCVRVCVRVTFEGHLLRDCSTTLGHLHASLCSYLTRHLSTFTTRIRLFTGNKSNCAHLYLYCKYTRVEKWLWLKWLKMCWNMYEGFGKSLKKVFDKYSHQNASSYWCFLSFGYEAQTETPEYESASAQVKSSPDAKTQGWMIMFLLCVCVHVFV